MYWYGVCLVNAWKVSLQTQKSVNDGCVAPGPRNTRRYVVELMVCPPASEGAVTHCKTE